MARSGLGCSLDLLTALRVSPKLPAGSVGSMRWFRKNIWVGSRAALLALAVQLFCFSHVHLELSSTAPSTFASLADSGPDDNRSPTTPAPKHDPFCVVCVLIQMAGNAVHAAAPVLDDLQRFGWSPPNTSVALQLFASPRGSFSARAPPFA